MKKEVNKAFAGLSGRQVVVVEQPGVAGLNPKLLEVLEGIGKKDPWKEFFGELGIVWAKEVSVDELDPSKTAVALTDIGPLAEATDNGHKYYGLYEAGWQRRFSLFAVPHMLPVFYKLMTGLEKPMTNLVYVGYEDRGNAYILGNVKVVNRIGNGYAGWYKKDETDGTLGVDMVSVINYHPVGEKSVDEREDLGYGLLALLLMQAGLPPDLLADLKDFLNISDLLEFLTLNHDEKLWGLCAIGSGGKCSDVDFLMSRKRIIWTELRNKIRNGNSGEKSKAKSLSKKMSEVYLNQLELLNLIIDRPEEVFNLGLIHGVYKTIVEMRDMLMDGFDFTFTNSTLNS